MRVSVEPGRAGARVDAVIAAAVPGLTVNGARRLIGEGRVRLDGRRARKGDRVSSGQVLEIDDGTAGDGAAAGGVGAGVGKEAARVRPDPSLEVRVLHVDDALVAIDKPAGIASHPLRAGELGTAANAIVARFPECALASPDAREGGLAHRLDRETSGVLLAARGADVWPRLRAALGGDDCTKTYLAEVVGRPPERGVTDAPIGRAGRRGERVRVGGGGRNPLDARTEWEVVEQRDATALVRARLHAGRPHQVRAHLASAGLPIVGDAKYGASGEGAPPLRLHAAAIAFRHPVSGALILIEAPAPGWAIMRA